VRVSQNARCDQGGDPDRLDRGLEQFKLVNAQSAYADFGSGMGCSFIWTTRDRKTDWSS
jgi:hypothetical protein